MRYGDDVECVGPLSVGVSCLHLHIGVSVWDLAKRNGVVSFFHIYPFPVVNSVGESDVGWGVEHKCGEEEGKCLVLTVDGKFVCSGEEMLAVNGVGTDADALDTLIFSQRLRFLQPGLSFGSDNPYSVIFEEEIGESPSFQLLCCSNPTSFGFGVVFLHDSRRENPEPSLVVGSDFQHLVAVQVSCDGVVLEFKRRIHGHLIDIPKFARYPQTRVAIGSDAGEAPAFSQVPHFAVFHGANPILITHKIDLTFLADIDVVDFSRISHDSVELLSLLPIAVKMPGGADIDLSVLS